MRYRTKPSIVEARQFTEDCDWDELGTWCGAENFGWEWEEMFMDVPTPGGPMPACQDDWIVKRDGKFSVCTPSEFEATYEPFEQRPLIHIEPQEPALRVVVIPDPRMRW